LLAPLPKTQMSFFCGVAYFRTQIPLPSPKLIPFLFLSKGLAPLGDIADNA
jgi:hypothetical protein